MNWLNMDFGRNGRKNAAPVNRMGAVSPAARDNPRIVPVSIPETEYGNTFVLIDCHFVAPRASAPSLYELGTFFNASSLAVIVQGNVMSPNVKPDDRTEVPKFIIWTNSITPNSPYTIEGTPDRFRIAILITRVILVSFAYSFR